MILYTMVTGHMPFDDSNMKNLLKQIKRGVDFHKPKQYVPDDCKDLIRSMLTIDSAVRITVPDISVHHWLQVKRKPSFTSCKDGASRSGV